MEIDFFPKAPAPSAEEEPHACGGSTASQHAAAGAPPSPQQPQHPVASTSGGGDAQQQAEEDAAAAAAAALAPTGPSISAHLARLLASVGDRHAPSGHQLLVLAAHAAMLETGFAFDGAAASPPAVASIATSVTTSGGAYDAAALLANGSGGSYTLSYRFGQLPAADPAEASGSGGTATPAGCPAVLVRCMEVGQHTVVAGMVVPAASNTGGTPNATTSSSGGAGSSPPRPLRPATSLQSLSLSVARYCSRPADPATSSDHNQEQPGRASLAPAELPELWIKLRDRLALPLLAAACAAAGLPPPAGLLTLPWELQEIWLRLLAVRCRSGLEAGAASRLIPDLALFKTEVTVASAGLTQPNHPTNQNRRLTLPSSPAAALSSTTWPPSTPSGARWWITTSNPTPRRPTAQTPTRGDGSARTGPSPRAAPRAAAPRTACCCRTRARSRRRPCRGRRSGRAAG
jgi:hypothetical protein